MMCLEVPAQSLFAFDRLEQCLEIPFAERPRALPLDDLVEQRRPVLHRFREDLQQVSIRIAIDENSELLENVDRLVDPADAPLELAIIARGNAEKLHSAIPKRRDRMNDVVGREGEMLNARASIEVQILLDLRLLLPRGGFVDGEFDLLFPVRHLLRDQ